ncbi:uncharacterized protein LOC114241515 [Bombyx mandarina]|uniref:Uncharacterized protein LOC114241515 n=1 Tax=Bombyx mandarina TaxID=7092 RepID=A0A6J2JFA5_BOMMA|nr:uncharacterized protein LOC114241515 [Bombyx mandarina]
MSSRKCKYDADAFCFICGQFIKVRDVKYELKTSHVLCEAYEAYFDCPVRNQDKPWAPHVACSYCKRCLEGWYRGEKRSMKFAIPRIWREPKDHITDCYFCMVNPSKRRRGNNKAENYEKLVEDMLTNFKAMGCRMSLKVHMLHAHLDKFKNNMGAYSEEQGERFHQDIMNFEQRYQGQYNENMMGDYIWGLLRESSYEHKRKSKSVHF